MEEDIKQSATIEGIEASMNEKKEPFSLHKPLSPTTTLLMKDSEYFQPRTTTALTEYLNIFWKPSTNSHADFFNALTDL